MKVFSRKINIHIFLVSILLIFVFSNILGLQNIELNFLPYPFEKSVLELIQSTILLSTIFIYIQSRKFFIKRINSSTFYLKLIMLIFLIYEENSFFTTGFSDFFNSVNDKNEINFHNMDILNNLVFSDIYIYGIDTSLNLTLSGFLILIFLLIIGFGSYLSKSKKIRFLSLEKKLSIYSLICLIELIISFIFRNLFNLKIDLLTWEQVELYIYLLLLTDSILKTFPHKNKPYFKS